MMRDREVTDYWINFVAYMGQNTVWSKKKFGSKSNTTKKQSTNKADKSNKTTVLKHTFVCYICVLTS